MSNSAEVLQTLRAAIDGGVSVDVDCSGLTFIDSTGAHALLDAYRLAADAHVCLRLTGLHHGPLRVLTVLGVLDLFDGGR